VVQRPDFWIGTSWKMNKTLTQAQEFATALAAAEDRRDIRIQRFVIPPYTTMRHLLAYEPVWAIGAKGVPARTIIDRPASLERGTGLLKCWACEQLDFMRFLFLLENGGLAKNLSIVICQ